MTKAAFAKINGALVPMDADGQVYHVPQSIAFESMDQVAFNRFFERAVYVVCERLLPAQNWEALRDEIIEAVDGDVARRFTDAADLGRAA